MANATYKVLKRLRHNGQQHTPGDPATGTVELTDAQAKRLLELGTVEAIKPAKAEAKAAKADDKAGDGPKA